MNQDQLTSISQWMNTLSPNPTGFCSDSRTIRPDQVFVATKGEKFDGHQFVETLLAQGIPGAIVSKTFAAKLSPTIKSKVFEVDNTHLAHRQIAHLFRLRFKGIIVGIGGSSGKTSTKEFLYHILSDRFRCFKTYKSQNGELGIPKTLEQLSPNIDVGIVEIGIDAPGDMARHADLVRPNIAALTSIGEEHLNLLKSVDNVFKEEKILFDVTLKNKGECFAPAHDSYLKTLEKVSPSIFLVDADKLSFQMPFTHPYAIQNAALAARIALKLGMDRADIQAKLDTLEIPEGRGREIRLKDGSLILADHYNANPSSMRGGLHHAVATAKHENKPLYLILGDMLDLGTQTLRLHQLIASDIDQCQAGRVVLVGDEMSKLRTQIKPRLGPSVCFSNSEEAAKNFDKIGLSLPAVILIKGSRGMALERVLDILLASNK